LLCCQNNQNIYWSLKNNEQCCKKKFDVLVTSLSILYYYFIGQQNNFSDLYPTKILNFQQSCSIFAIISEIQAVVLNECLKRIIVRKIFSALKSWKDSQSPSLACDYRIVHFFLSGLGDQKRE